MTQSHQNNTLAFILSAGLGTRLGKITANKPKALVEINGVPLLESLLLKLKSEGFTHCIVNVHHFANQITDFLKKKNNFGLEIQISDESNQLMDTAGALLQALPLMQGFDNLLVHNVDVVADISLNNFVEIAQKDEADAMLLLKERDSSRKLLFDNEMQLKGWHHLMKNEYKFVKNAPKPLNEYAFSGIHFMKKHVLNDYEPKVMGFVELYLDLAEKHKVKGLLRNEGYWFDLGKQDEIQLIEEQLLSLQAEIKKEEMP